jgi:RNA polymerase sigma factor (sigma-70 family)
MDESALIEKCLKGDQLAQRTLFDKYAPKMFSVALRYAKDTDQSEDVLQDAFVKVFMKLDRYNGKGSFEGWIRRIVVNTALDSIRKNIKFQDNISSDDVAYKLEQHVFTGDSLDEKFLLKTINSMPEGYKTVFNMFAIEGYSHKEIAKELDISENTSKSQYSRARAYLKQRLKELGFERD